jgi:hypothetical protein
VLNDEGKEVKVKDAGGTRPLQCWDATVKTVVKAASRTSSTFKPGDYTTAYQMAMEHKTEDRLVYDKDATKKAIIAILDHINEQRPIQVGVNYVWKHGINKDLSTDHWITITSMKYDQELNEYYFEFFDPGTNFKDAGIDNQTNRLYLREKDGNYILQANRSVAGDYSSSGFVNYEVTCVRPNSDVADKSGTINQENGLKEENTNCETIKCK